MSLSEPDTLKKIIRETLEPVETIQLAYLFGSGAQGHLTASSDVDVDVAVGFENPSDPFERFLFLGKMEDLLRPALKRDVDVTDLYRASPVLQHQILKNGRPAALVRDDYVHLNFENLSRKRYFEMKIRYRAINRELFR